LGRVRRLVPIAIATVLAAAAVPAHAESEQGQPHKTQTPRLARTVVVKATDGRVTVKPRGHKRITLTSRPIAISMRSLVDTTHGKVKLISAKPRGGTQSGVFSEGAFVVTQRRSDGLTDLTLSGGDFSACNKAAAAGAPITDAKRNRRRRLFGRAHGRFRSRGRSSSATVKGTDWLTEDRCTGTVTQNKSKSTKSKVETATHDRLHFELDPGQTITYYCNVLAVTPNTYCLILLAQPADGLIAGGILTTVKTTDYDLCVQAPDGQEGCERNLPLTKPDESGFRQAVFACPVRQVGRYVFAWSLDHQNLLYPSLALTLSKVGPNVDCQFDPPRPTT
jgi:archaeosine-15-forming tRNA-guanine transglycosylase